MLLYAAAAVELFFLFASEEKSLLPRLWADNTYENETILC